MLIASLSMTGIRAWAQKGLVKAPVCIPILEKIELVWVALHAVQDDWPVPEVQNKPDHR